MKVWFKRILISLLVLVLVALVGLATFLLAFDPNAYKSKFEEIVYKRYQRTLVIKGDIQLSLFPRIGLSVQGVSLSDRNSENIFASVDSARFAVAIWPLLSSRLVVDHVAVSGFKAWVKRNKRGHFNFDDLINNSPSALESAPIAAGVAVAQTVDAARNLSEASALKEPAEQELDKSGRTDLQIDIAGLDLKDGELHVYDSRSGYVARLLKLQVNTGRMTFDQPFDVSWRGKIMGDFPQADASIEGQALVKIDPAHRAYSAQKIDVRMSGLIGTLQAKTATLRGNLAYSASSRFLNASGLELLVQGGVNGDQPIKNLEASLMVPQLKVDQGRSELEVGKLSFRAKGSQPKQNFDIAFDAPKLSISPEAAKGDAVAGTVKLTAGQSVLGLALAMNGLGGNAQNLTLKELKVQGNLKQGDRLTHINVSSPVKWDGIKEQATLSAIKGDVKVEDKTLSDGPFEFPLIGGMHIDLVKDELTTDINAVLNGTQLNFNVKAIALSNPEIQFALNAEALDLDALFPKAKPAVASPLKTDVAKSAEPSAKPADKPAVAKNVAAKEPEQDPVVLDLSMLESLDVTGSVKIGDLRVRGVHAKNVGMAIRARNGSLEFSKLAADLYQGRLTGKIVADWRNTLTAQLALEGASVGPILRALAGQDRLSGKGTLKLNLHTQGKTEAQLKAALGGTVQIALRDGSVRGINLTQTLTEIGRAVQKALSGQIPDVASKFDLGQQTDFTSLDANIMFDRGQGVVKKLAVEAPLLRVSQGTPASINLVSNQLDFVANVRVVNTAKGQSGKDLASLRGVTVPLHISGPFDALHYQVQWKQIGGRLVQDAITGGLLDLIGKKADTESAAPAGKTAPPASANPADRVKNLGNTLKGLLGK